MNIIKKIQQAINPNYKLTESLTLLLEFHFLICDLSCLQKYKRKLDPSDSVVFHEFYDLAADKKIVFLLKRCIHKYLIFVGSLKKEKLFP